MTQDPRLRETSGKNGRLKRIKPYVPILSRTPARIIDPAVGASTCASGSQVWKGKSGTLMQNARANASHNHVLSGLGIRDGSAASLLVISTMSKVFPA